MFKSALTTLLVASTAFAACSFSTEGHGFEMNIYGQTSCGTGNHHEEFFGAGVNPACDCFNIATALNDKVKSFVFTASTRHSINIFKDGNCKGTVLGTSVGNWIDSTVSTAGQQMSSFEVCLF
ncbi:hypothetical protein GALMADRAFT_222090 [Galerina marginata CBS 339.88]|uniref:Uncharacterized protein n=1 Tax=Galerina marginata (strain CBS 339.88) TaxID=685588 RepID=A0A067TGC5_GALM3|nr:hypothetical protein GALMADRAFT_222090 [Galerina marginata CBS 339.88]